MQQNSKTQNVKKKKPKNLNYDKTKKKKLWQNSKTQFVTKLKKHKLWQNSKILIVTKLKNANFDGLKNSNCDKTQKINLL